MGYSFAVPLQSAKARDKMLAFLQANMRPWTNIMPPEGRQVSKDYDYTQYLCRDGELSYDHGKCRIGVNFSTGGEPFEYIYAVFRWVAVRCGRTRSFPVKLGHPERVPYVVYDGYQAWPLLPAETWADRGGENWNLVDLLGWMPVDRVWQHWDTEAKKFSLAEKAMVAREKIICDAKDRVIRAEIERLEALWIGLASPVSP